MIELVIARLQAVNQAERCFRIVAGAAEFAEVAGDRPPAAVPACYVVPLAEDVVNIDHPGWSEDLVTIQFATVLVVQEKSDARGGAATLAVAAPRAMVRKALSGFAPAGADEVIRYAGGRLMAFDAGRLWWQDNWAVPMRLPTEEN
ncbi:MAG: phage tail terminator protein [Ferrovibrionaceae bacterium]